MTKPTILVTGATGKIGGVVARELLSAGYPVRALARAQDARSAALQAAGADVAFGSIGDPDVARSALCGIQRAFFLPPFDPTMLDQAKTFAAAIEDAGLEAVTTLSQWLASPSHPSVTTRQHWHADRLFAALPGIALTKVAPGYFADSYLALIDYAAHLAILPSLYGESRNAPPSNEDIGRVAAAALMDPDRHAGKSYRPTGPTLLSERDMAAILSRVLGWPVYRMPMPTWMFVRAARLDGYGIAQMDGATHYITDHRQGAFELGAPTSDVLDVTGRAPEDFETIARRYASRPSALPTDGNRLRQLLKFMRVPLSPGYDFKRYRRTLQPPQPDRLVHAAMSEVWRREHAIPPLAGVSGGTAATGGGALAPEVARS